MRLCLWMCICMCVCMYGCMPRDLPIGHGCRKKNIFFWHSPFSPTPLKYNVERVLTFARPLAKSENDLLNIVFLGARGAQWLYVSSASACKKTIPFFGQGGWLYKTIKNIITGDAFLLFYALRTQSLRTSLPKHNKLGAACEFLPRASEKCALCHPHLTARLLNSERIGRRSIDLEKGAPRKVWFVWQRNRKKNRISVWDCMCQVYVSRRQKKKMKKLCHTSSPFERKRLSKKSPELLSRAACIMAIIHVLWP